MKRVCLLAAAVLVMAIAAIPTAARADSVAPANWTFYMGSSPSPRVWAAIAYDSARGRIVLFGGYPEGMHTPLGDTWEWDGAHWTQIQPATAPRSRGAAGMAFDADRNRMVLFGGNYLGDTWEYDGTNWSQIATPVSPPARAAHGMAYHAASRRVVLFGGGGVPGFGDTWEFDGKTWLQRQPRSSPGARSWAPLAYDSGRQRTVLFGGQGSGGRLGDTWEWDGNNWSERQLSSSPAKRFGHTLTYDNRRGVSVLFGGDVFPYSDETWEWDGTGWTLRWTMDWPPERVWAAAAFDSARGHTLLFGGNNLGRFNAERYFNEGWPSPYATLDDTWLYEALPPRSPGAALMPHKLWFYATPVGGSSPPQAATVHNSGGGPTTISSITTSGPFVVAASDCPTSPDTLAIGASCKVQVVFKPADRGQLYGQLTLTDDAGTGTQKMVLGGSAEYSYANVQPERLDFGDQAAGTTSDPRMVSVTAINGVSLTIFGFKTGGEFEVTNVDCPLSPETLAPFATCRVHVTFRPHFLGVSADTLIITHSGQNNPSLVRLTGRGV